MQTVIRPLALAVAVLSLAGSALAGPAQAPSSPAPQQESAQPVSASSAKPAKEKAETTLVATGKIVQFDTTGQALTLSTSKGEQQFTVGPTARLQESSHAITVADLGRMTGHKATVRYKEAAGEKTVESIRVASSTAKTSTKS